MQLLIHVFIYPHFLFLGCVERALIEKVEESQGCYDKIPPYRKFFTESLKNVWRYFMKCGYTRKWVHPKKMITQFSETFKDVEIKKTRLRNLRLVVLAVAAAKTFRINAIASRLPSVGKKEKSKQKRLLRFLETPLPLDPSWRQGVFSAVAGSGKGHKITSMGSSMRPTSLTVGKHSGPLSLFATALYLCFAASMKTKISET